MTDEIAEQASAALGMAAANEMLRKELAAANAIIHTMQDGALVRDQAGVIERAEARIATIQAERDDAIARAERAEAECKALREALESLASVARVKMRDPPFALMQAQKLLADLEARAALNASSYEPRN